MNTIDTATYFQREIVARMLLNDMSYIAGVFAVCPLEVMGDGSLLLHHNPDALGPLECKPECEYALTAALRSIKFPQKLTLVRH